MDLPVGLERRDGALYEAPVGRLESLFTNLLDTAAPVLAE